MQKCILSIADWGIIGIEYIVMGVDYSLLPLHC